MTDRIGNRVVVSSQIIKPENNVIIPEGDKATIIDVDDEGIVVLRLDCFYPELLHCRNLICIDARTAKQHLKTHHALLSFCRKAADCNGSIKCISAVIIAALFIHAVRLRTIPSLWGVRHLPVKIHSCKAYPINRTTRSTTA